MLVAVVRVATSRGPATVIAEVAATPQALQQGLMFRRYLHPDAGMLFIMGRRGRFAFHMRNTMVPLDMIFIDEDLRIVGIVQDADPFSEAVRSVGRPAVYVLEVNGGWARDNGVVAGDLVEMAWVV